VNPVIERYQSRAAAIDSLLCVGLDTALERLPDRFRAEPHPQFTFNRWLIDQTHPYVSACKPNMAFYEARGTAGWDELARTMEYLHANHPDIVTICDAKRGDIDTTNVGYVQGIFEALGFDAITLHPYLGASALQVFLDRADKVSIILCRTSNSGAGELQNLHIDGVPLWEHIAVRVRDHWNANGNCMLVIGATQPADLARARALCPDMTFLVPGVGAQGGDAAEVVRAGADASGSGLIVNAGRSIAGSDDPARAARALRDAMRAARG
jgi:orotidine-5'-phosphate decarboxylase